MATFAKGQVFPQGFFRTCTVTDIDNNVYSCVTIGTQTWMVENLKTTHYRNGEDIPNITVGTDWSTLVTGAYCWYNNDAATYKATYGALYNWYAVADARNIAPVGWHVATDAEWTTLTTFLNGESVAGGKLKEILYTHWKSTNTGASNSSGFTALPGGYRNGHDGSFNDVGLNGVWWSSTAYDASSAWNRALYYYNANAYRGNYGKQNGFSVRCVRDLVPTVTTTAATSITATTATSGGNVTNSGEYPITARGVCWSTTTGPTAALATKTTETGTAGVFTSSLSNLASNTTYYVRAYATNSAGTAYGSEVSFKTLLAIGDAYQGGKVAYILQVGDPGYDATFQKGLIVALSNQSISNWIEGGSTFTTLNGNTLLTIGTGQANTNFMISQTGYTGGAAKICDDYSVTVGGVTYSDWYLPSKDELNKLYLNQAAIGSFSFTYWSSSEYSNDMAWKQVFTGGLQTINSKNQGEFVRAIRTFPTLPTVITTAATSITTTTATSGGNVTNAGDYPITARGVCWSTNTGPTTALATKTTETGTTGIFTSSLSNLASNTTYYVRAYAASLAGTSYGNEVIFKTLLAIGDTYQGGQIVYFFQSGDPGYVGGETHGLIVSPYDNSTEITWGNNIFVSAFGLSIGDGPAATRKIVDTLGPGYYAAYLCDTLTLNGYTDWYLPSRDELRNLFYNRYTIGGVDGGAFWTSLESNANYAYISYFGSNLMEFTSTKSTTRRVRAFRTF